MKTNITAGWIILLLALPLYAVEVGQPAPDINGVTLEGDTLQLSHLQGKVVLIDFWASWCTPCKQAMPFFVEFYNRHQSDDFVLLSINIDKKEKNMKTFLDSLEPAPTFPILWDQQATLPPRYELAAMPTTYFIDKKGIVQSIHTGFNPSEKAEYESTLQRLLKDDNQ